MISNFSAKTKKSAYMCPLQKFYLNYNPQITPSGWRNLTTALLTLGRPSLTVIELRNCNINGEKLNEILRAFQTSFAVPGVSSSSISFSLILLSQRLFWVRLYFVTIRRSEHLRAFSLNSWNSSFLHRFSWRNLTSATAVLDHQRAAKWSRHSIQIPKTTCNN